MRSVVSVPGIRNDRGNLPPMTGAVVGRVSGPNPGTSGPGALGPAWESWSRRRWISSWLFCRICCFACRSASSSALTAGKPVNNTIPAMDPPIFAKAPVASLLVIATPPFDDSPELRTSHLLWADGSQASPSRHPALGSSSEYLPLRRAYATHSGVWFKRESGTINRPMEISCSHGFKSFGQVNLIRASDGLDQTFQRLFDKRVRQAHPGKVGLGRDRVPASKDAAPG